MSIAPAVSRLRTRWGAHSHRGLFAVSHGQPSYLCSPEPHEANSAMRRLIGHLTIAFTSIYLLSDVVEVAQGDFSTLRLVLTYAGEAAIPFFVLGLYLVQRPQIGRLGLAGAAAYSYAYVFFTSTVVYALVAGTPNYRSLTTVFGAWMTIHGLVMLLGGVAFGVAIIRANVLPRWTGVGLVAGVILVSAASGLPNFARALAEAVPAIAFIGMGSALLQANRSRGTTSPRGPLGRDAVPLDERPTARPTA